MCIYVWYTSKKYKINNSSDLQKHRFADSQVRNFADTCTFADSFTHRFADGRIVGGLQYSHLMFG